MSRFTILIVVAALSGAGLSCAPRDTAKTNWKDGRDALLAGNYKDAASLLGRTAEQLPNVSEVHYLLGCALLNLGEMPRSEAAFRQALSGKPGYAEAMVGLAQIEFHREHYDESGRLFRQALSGKTESAAAKAAAYNGLAGIEKTRGNNPMYRLHLFEAAAAAPDDACTLYNLGVMHRDTYKNPESALECFNRYLRLGDVNSSQREKARSAIAYIEKQQLLRKKSTGGSADGKALIEGTEALAARAYDWAANCFKKVLKNNPDSFQAAWGLGMANQRRGDAAGALEAFKTAARINPVHIESYSRAATLAIGLKRYKDAEAILDAALSGRKPSASMVKQMATVYSATGRKDAARAYGRFYQVLLRSSGQVDNSYSDWFNSL